jgi:xanthine dehydrogenase accessory factor
MSVWPTIERSSAEHGAAARVTLAEARGSSSRKVGARMAVRPDGGFSGPVGGGALESAALAEAQAPPARRGGNAVRPFTWALGPELGQCCGGRVPIMVREATEARMPVPGSIADDHTSPRGAGHA